MSVSARASRQGRSRSGAWTAIGTRYEAWSVRIWRLARLSRTLRTASTRPGQLVGRRGVCITHAALINHERWIADYAPLSAADRALQNTPISFDGSIFEYWSQILSGGTCVLSNPHIRRDPQVILEEMARYGITVFQTVPSFLLALMEADEARQLAHLHFVYVGGEVLPLEVQRQFIERYGAKLHNAYGPHRGDGGGHLLGVPRG